MKMIKSRCQKCNGKTWIWAQKAGVHSSDPERMDTNRVRTSCPECDGRGWHAIKTK